MHLLEYIFQFRIANGGPCEEFTIKYCDLEPEDVIDTLPATDAANCQDFCIIFANCYTFQFQEGNCILMKRDYRQECEFNAGPKVYYKLVKVEITRKN